MMNTKAVIGLALAGLLGLGATAGSQAGPAEKPKFEAEKCYGIVKAGKNDCQTAYSACAGTSKKDNEATAWTYLPKGTCDRIVGGSLKPKV